MQQPNGDIALLQLLRQPAFRVEQGIITHVNSEASAYLLTEGTEVGPLIAIGGEEYENFTSGCLYLTLRIGLKDMGACVMVHGDGHLFLLDRQENLAQLQSLALAARELREPLAGMMAAADRLLPAATREENPQAKLHAAQMNRRMFQIMRIVNNMSDAVHYAQGVQPLMETVNMTSFLDELFGKAAVLSAKAGIALHYSGLTENVYTQADRDRLERAIYNLLSNAMKACPAGGMMEVKVTHRRHVVVISVTDNGCGIEDRLLGDVYTRFLRAPSLESGGSGLGLGMTLVRSVAALHGGTVLIDRPNGQGTRVSLSIAVRRNPSTVVRSPILRVDYAGERDHGLLELADVLPAELYGAE